MSDSTDPDSGGGLSAKLRRGNLMTADCPSRIVLKHLTSRWGVLILITLQTGTHRFSDLRRKIGGVSERMLAETLQFLQADGMVDRKEFQVVPPHVEYTLTPLGEEAAEKVRLLADWIEINLPRVEESWERNVARGDGVKGRPLTYKKVSTSQR